MTAPQPEPYALARGEGASIPPVMPGAAAIVKAGATTGATFTLYEGTYPPAWGPPPHIHADEDELFYVLEGRLYVRCGRNSWQLEAGGTAFCPRGIPHRPSTDAEKGCRVLVLTSRSAPGLDQFFLDVADRMRGQPPGPPSRELLNEVGQKYGYTHVSPNVFDQL
jgi:quercetin dioxygenase-like cupin family protein